VADRGPRRGARLGLVLAAPLLAGCGYGTRGSLPDHIKTVAVVGYSLDRLAFDRNANVRAYRLRLVLNVEFRDVRRRALLWRQEGLEETSDFQVEGQVSDTVAPGQGAVQQAASEIGRKVVSLAVDRF
jgi:hypothetical protein